MTGDGLGRRTTISHTLAGGGATVATTYVWCGDKPCQACDASNQPQRAYYTEGERLLGSSPASLYYGVDQIGSVRRVFASATNAPAYGYDPYGVPLQTTAPLTDFGYAGLITEPDSGLGLATYRTYDPRVGRWLSRDPIGERGSRAGNLYDYVGGDPLANIDPEGKEQYIRLCMVVLSLTCGTPMPPNVEDLKTKLTVTLPPKKETPARIRKP